jgi:hypothetical protein
MSHQRGGHIFKPWVAVIVQFGYTNGYSAPLRFPQRAGKRAYKVYKMKFVQWNMHFKKAMFKPWLAD